MSGAAAIGRRKLVVRMGAVAALAVLLGAATFLPAAEEQVRAEVAQKVLPAFAGVADKAAKVSVTTSEETYTLWRANGVWMAVERGNYPVEAERVAKLTRALAAVVYARPMTRDEKKMDRIGLGDPAVGGTGALVEVSDASGAVLAKLIVGYREGKSYVREVGDLQAWAVEGAEMPPLQRGAAWLNLDETLVAVDDIAEVQMRPHEGSWYTLLAGAVDAREYKLAQPHVKKRIIAAFGPVMVAEALAHMSPIDVARADKVATGIPYAQVIVLTRGGVSVVAQCWRRGEKGWVTLGAAVAEKASGEAVVAAQRINARTSGWAYAVSENDWNALTTPLAALAE